MQKDFTDNNKRIAKNTLYLYIRMLLTLAIKFYTVRLVLKILGVVDYGIYDVVGSIVVMFSIFTKTMASVSYRFFAFELGKNDVVQLKKTFCMTVNLYAILSVIIFVLAETAGLWFLNEKMVIPPERMSAANWVFQFSILAFIVAIMSIPYYAIIISHEKMKVYAYFSIIEVLLQLVIILFLTIFPIDKLKLYAVLMFFTQLIIRSLYSIYCRRKYDESRFSFIWDKSLFKSLVSFSGWNLFNATSQVLNSYGINIILNLFFGPVVNAARGIAHQITSALSLFIQNFTTAINPQIFKYYASDEKDEMMKLGLQSSKLSFFLVSILALPILFETSFVLSVWLKNVPDYARLFSQLVIVTAMIEVLSKQLYIMANASGRIKYFHMVVGSVMMLNLPVSYLFFRLGFPPYTTFIVAMVNSVVCLMLRLLMLKKIIGLSLSRYMKNVMMDIFIVIFASSLLPLFFKIILNTNNINSIIVILISFISSLISVYFLGLNKGEKQFIVKIIYKIINRKNN